MPSGSISPDLPSTFPGMGMRLITYLIRPDGTVARRFIGELDASDIELMETATR